MRDTSKISPRLQPGMKPGELDGCDEQFFDGGQPRHLSGYRADQRRHGD
jgi:hypothetical protein